MVLVGVLICLVTMESLGGLYDFLAPFFCLFLYNTDTTWMVSLVNIEVKLDNTSVL